MNQHLSINDRIHHSGINAGNLVWVINAASLLLALIVMVGSALFSPQASAQTAVPPQAMSAQARSTYTNEADRQLARYTKLVPEMGFLRLYGKAANDVEYRLPLLLGEGAVNVDYEHTATQRGDLMEAQLYRLKWLISENLPSATLFKVGKGSVFKHPYLCVITLDTRPYRNDPHYATRLLTAEYSKWMPVSKDKPLIDNDMFVNYTVAHEAAHCLDAYFNGPSIKTTQDGIKGHYQHYLTEARADAFATQAFLRTASNPEPFLKKIAAIRSASLLELDLQHFTGDVIRHVMNAPVTVEKDNLQQQIAIGRQQASEIVPSLKQYGVWLSSSLKLHGDFHGKPASELPETETVDLPPCDEALVSDLMSEVTDALQVLRADDSKAIQVSEAGSGRITR